MKTIAIILLLSGCGAAEQANKLAAEANSTSTNNTSTATSTGATSESSGNLGALPAHVTASQMQTTTAQGASVTVTQTQTTIINAAPQQSNAPAPIFEVVPNVTWSEAMADIPEGYHMPRQDEYSELASITAHSAWPCIIGDVWASADESDDMACTLDAEDSAGCNEQKKDSLDLCAVYIHD